MPSPPNVKPALVVLIYLSLLFNISSCRPPLDPPVEKPLHWSSHSFFMMDSNLVMEVPGVQRIKTSMERKCYSPGYMHYWFTSQIANDTVRTHVRTTLEVIECHYYSADKWLEDIVLYFRERHPHCQVVYKQKLILVRDTLCYAKFADEGKNYHNIYFCHKGGHIKVEIENLRDEKAFEHIIHSISFEERERFICW